MRRRWDLPKAKPRYRGLITEGRAGPGAPRVAVLLPQTFMNESGTSVGPARGALGADLGRIIVVHDEIDLPFGTVQSRLGGGLAGHNGLKSTAAGVGGSDFWRVRLGVGRPDSTDPEIVSRHVLGRFAESGEEVRDLIAAGAGEVEDLIGRIASGEADGAGSAAGDG